MALYRMTKEKMEAVRQTSFVEERLLERKDLQRLLKVDISVLGVLAYEDQLSRTARGLARSSALAVDAAERREGAHSK